jgi:hypothetical protein
LRGVDETQQIDVYEEEAVKYNLQPVALGLFGGVYDTRDWNAIRSWAKELAQKVRCSKNFQK